MSSNIKILIIDDEKSGRETFQMLLDASGYTTFAAASTAEARKILANEVCHIVLSDINMPGTDGITFLKEIKDHFGARVEVIMITGYASVETAVEAMKRGAFGYFIKSNDPTELLMEIDKAIARMRANNYDFEKAVQTPDHILYSHSPKMQKVWELIDLVADSKANILITGESGTGKEIIARQIHQKSSRAKQPYVALNCQQYPDELIESELFGHEKGAFTGASKTRIGKLEQANGGTVFLDEIGDVSMETQTKLLRTLEQRVVERIGSNKVSPVDFRLITATNKNIPAEIAAGRFREDFYYRINTIEIKVPPLRERREDLPDLIEFFIKKFSTEMKTPIKKIDTKSEAFLLNYDYKGNIRELKNIIERMIILSGNSDELSLNGEFTDSVDDVVKTREQLSYKDAKKCFEQEYITKTLEENGGNITKTAEIIGMSRRQLFNKITELGIDVENMK